jgi:hypothetical protein
VEGPDSINCKIDPIIPEVWEVNIKLFLWCHPM